jgi:hypothetical protein
VDSLYLPAFRLNAPGKWCRCRVEHQTCQVGVEPPQVALPRSIVAPQVASVSCRRSTVSPLPFQAAGESAADLQTGRVGACRWALAEPAVNKTPASTCGTGVAGGGQVACGVLTACRCCWTGPH